MSTGSERRQLGNSDLVVSPIGMGCWPIAGMTTLDVTREAALATLRAAVDAGITFFDTAYCYGAAGESERMVGEALRPVRNNVVIASKGGIHWTNGQQTRDASPKTIRRQCDESLSRLGIEQLDLLYLHGPDPATPIAESAGAFRELQLAGKARWIAASNLSLSQLMEFAAVCPIVAFQPHYNMLQREIETAQLPWCIANQVAVVVYWPLMKGLLAGHLERNRTFDPRDGRRKYPMFSGEEWQRNQDFVDALRPIAAECGKTVSQLVLNWTIQQPGITVALCGARRPEQITENAGGMNWRLNDSQLQRIATAIAARGTVASRAAVT